ncbi:ATP-grasp domain-containing protein [Halalkalibacterium ligniniphilum]|uniref:ATP-grasp domain-containing protein n=1 Tax=Halalkalibacterium ligniniphilum TaxID=1134413 RepID=UPI000346C89A|nr:ATP-grasp domain-containing protein [Halalkalibacterium ligniniphilum]
MSILILNGYPHEHMPYEQWLEDSEEELILITSKIYENEFPKEKYKEIIGFENYENNSNVEIHAIELHKKYNFSKLIATYEFDLLRAANLREFLKIPGQDYNSALAFRDKLLMKQISKENNLNVPIFEKLTNAVALSEFIDQNGYPIVVKPRDGAGAEGVRIINDSSDLKLFLNDGIPLNFMVEEFIDAEMFHIDILTFDGEIIFNWPSAYLVSNLKFNEGGFAGSYLINEEHIYYEKIMKYSRELVSKFPSPKFGVFHIEVFVKEGEVILCEAACRPGGGKIVEQLSHAFNVNICEVFVKSQCDLYTKQEGASINKKPNKITGSILVPPLPKKIHRLPIESPPVNILEYRTYLNMDEQKNEATSLIDRIATFVIEPGEDMSIQESMNNVFTWFTDNLELEDTRNKN